MLREREALLFEEGGGGRQTGIEVTPGGPGAVAQSSETMAANTNQVAARAASTAGGGRSHAARPSRDAPPDAAVLLGDSRRHSARVRAGQGLWLRPRVHPSQRGHQDQGACDD